LISLHNAVGVFRVKLHQSGTAPHLRRTAEKIQRDLIEEPLIKLEERVKRMESIRRRKWSAYAHIDERSFGFRLAPSTAAPVVSALGALSISKIIETYFTDLEKDVPLCMGALYWLARLREGRR